MKLRLFWFYIALVAGLVSVHSEPVMVNLSRHQAPPTPPEILTNSAVTKHVFRSGPPPPGTRYFIGEPSDEEQLYLEYINRSRANPPAEGIRLRDTTAANVRSAYTIFAVDLNLMVSQFNTNPPVAPLSLNSNLTRAARLHSGDMFTNQFQGHVGTSGSSLAQRVNSAGYLNWTTLGENVYSYAEDVFYGHAGFNVDWGGSTNTGGMQSPPGHRNSIHSGGFREVGIGVVIGINGSVGPQLVTQDFGSRSGLTPFVTGVVYYDFNTNGFYDLGEGVGDVAVEIPGSAFYAITANSGGYSVPVTTNGNYAVIFSGDALTNFQTNVTVAGGSNKKVDFLPIYTPPVISGPAPAYRSQTNVYTFNPVGAATSYRWLSTRRIAFTNIEGAENGSTNVTAVISPGYALIVTDTKASGTSSFHLAHPEGETQTLTLNPSLRPGTNSQLIFASRLGWATSSQIARAQISVDAGTNWQTLWSQSGTGGSGQTSFTRKTNSLAAFAGEEIRVRFIYEFTGGGLFPQTDAGVGFYVDDISISNAEQLVEPVVTDIVSTNFNFVPATNANFLLQAAAKVSGRFLPYGPAKLVSVVNPLTSINITATRIVSSNIEIDFQVLNGTTNSFQLHSTTNLLNSFTNVGSASLQVLVLGNQYRFTTPRSGSPRFYRIRSP